jgi:hypothetical protein
VGRLAGERGVDAAAAEPSPARGRRRPVPLLGELLGGRATSLLRYDREPRHPRNLGGAALYADGRWRPDERPERNVWLGSDYGDEVPPARARRIAAAWGHPADVVVSESVAP